MTHPSIGGIQVASLDWQQSLYGTQVETWTRRGVAGHGAREDADRCNPTQAMSFTDFDSAANRASKLAEYKALMGTFVTILKADGQSVNNVLVLNVQAVEQHTGAIAVGGLTDGRYSLICRWDLQETEVP